MSSTDAVHAATALLEVGIYEPRGDGSGEVIFDAVASFWAAYESLQGATPRSRDLQQRGLDLAMQLQRAVVSVGGVQLSRRNVYQCGHFRYLNLDEAGLGEEAALLAHPLVLERLAAFLQDAHAHMGRSHKPVVVVGPKMAAHVLVVGVTGYHGAGTAGKAGKTKAKAGEGEGAGKGEGKGEGEGEGDEQPEEGGNEKEGNVFSHKFRKAADAIGAKYEASGFESNVIRIPFQEVQQFMDELITDM